MRRISRSPFFLLAALVVILACTCSVPAIGGSGSAASSVTDTPLTPNPLNVTLTLDTPHAVTNSLQVESGVARDTSMSATLPNGTQISMAIPGHTLNLGTDQGLVPAFGTTVTATPVSAIKGIPFSKGFLAAFQFTPEGLLMAEPASITIDLPQTIDAATLVGFASDGSGANFHLFPIEAFTASGMTSISFSVMHFSMYGVAQATASEVLAQQSQTPSTVGDQDDDLLAAPESQKQINLKKIHDQRVKPLIDQMDKLAGNCNDVAFAALTFEQWLSQVQAAGQQTHFQNLISQDASVLMERLKDCLKQTCGPCLNGGKPNKAAADKFLTQSTMMQVMDKAVDNMSDYNYWGGLANQCAKNAGRPLPEPPVADCGGVNCGPTPTALACP